MAEAVRTISGAARLEFQQRNRARARVAPLVLEAVMFLVLVGLSGVTGSRAPTALVDNDAVAPSSPV